VYISEEQIISGASIEAELLKFSEEKIQRMRETIVSFIPKLLYTRHSSEAGFQSVQGDAFDTTIEGVLKKVATYKDQVKLS
jgi:predicted lipase